MNKSKHVTLLSDKEDHFHWSVGLLINRNGCIRKRGVIETVNYEVSSEERRKRNERWLIWCVENRDEYNRKRRERRAKNSELYNQKHREYYAENAEQIKEKTLRPERNKRKRELGYIPLNERDDDSWEGHHLSKEFVVHAPHELHRSVRHNVFTDENMAEINGRILVWAGQYYG